MGDDATGGLIIGLAGDDDVGPSGQGAADRLIGFSANDNGVAKGNLFKHFLFTGNLPGNVSPVADNTIGCHGDDC